MKFIRVPDGDSASGRSLISPRSETEKRMKTYAWKWATAMSLFSALAMPLGMVAQDDEAQHHKPKHHTYKLIDLGTFGGPNSFVNGPLVPNISDSGTYAGGAETSIPDPYAPNCEDGDCLVVQAQRWRNGVVTDLGTLPGTNLNSGASWVSASGIIVGGSENGLIDPLLGVPENHGVIWTRDGNITDLGTLEGGNESFAAAVNNRGQVAGWAANTIPDSFSMGCIFVCFTTQTRGFVWRDGVVRDLGTLGGPDALTQAINERGQIVGISYTSSIPNPDSGIPTIDPFLWEDGRMVDIGTFGGTFSVASFINDQGQVVGTSNLAGDQTQHPYLWDRGSLKDLGTLGGDNGQAIWINNAGEVVGEADLPGSQTHDGFLWKNGVMTDLGNLGQTSFAFAINSEGQIVGHSKIDDGTFRAFLWEKGGPMVDLNMLVPPASDVVLADPYSINDRGEIAVTGFLPNGDEHAVILIPNSDCEDACEARITAGQNHAAVAVQIQSTSRSSESESAPINSMRYRFAQRSHIPGHRAVPLY
jgi:probable HAF family extracellular repeat protein